MLTVVLLATAPAAWAGTEWGADFFSAPRGAVSEAETAMGTTFESYAMYSNLYRVAMMDSPKMHQAMKNHALIFININSMTIGKKSGHLVPICWPDVAAGHRDGQ